VLLHRYFETRETGRLEVIGLHLANEARHVPTPRASAGHGSTARQHEVEMRHIAHHMVFTVHMPSN